MKLSQAKKKEEVTMSYNKPSLTAAKIAIVLAVILLVLSVLVLILLSAKPAQGASLTTSPLPVEYSTKCLSGKEIEVPVYNPNQYQGHLEIWLDGVEAVDDFPNGGSIITYTLNINDGGFARLHNVEIKFWAYDLFQWESTTVGPCEVGWTRSCENLGLVEVDTETDWVNDVQLIHPSQSKVFSAPANAEYTLINQGWQWRDSNENQDNESHLLSTPFGDVLVPDLGGGNDLTYWYDMLLAPLGDTTTFTATVSFAGDSSTNGSHWSHTKIFWCGASTQNYLYLPEILIFK